MPQAPCTDMAGEIGEAIRRARELERRAGDRKVVYCPACLYRRLAKQPRKLTCPICGAQMRVGGYADYVESLCRDFAARAEAVLEVVKRSLWPVDIVYSSRCRLAVKAGGVVVSLTYRGAFRAEVKAYGAEEVEHVVKTAEAVAAQARVEVVFRRLRAAPPNFQRQSGAWVLRLPPPG